MTKAIRLEPNSAYAADIYHYRGMAKLRLEQHAASITDFDVAIRLKPGYAEAYLVEELRSLNSDNTWLLSQIMTLQFGLKPDLIIAYYNRGVAKVKLGRTSGAKQDFRIALKLAEKAGDERFKTKIEEMLRLIESHSK